MEDRTDQQRLRFIEAQAPATESHLAPMGGVQEADAVETLITALSDPQVETRIRAAEELGRVGDARAVQPLMAALKANFGGKSAREFRTAGILIVVAIVVGFLALNLGLGALGVGAAMSGLGGPLVSVLTNTMQARKKQSEMSRAITEALGRIAERDPAPELRALVPELKAIAADSLQQEKGARAASREAAARIEVLTATLKDLPVPTQGAATGEAVLPRPAGPPAPDREQLPVVD